MSKQQFLADEEQTLAFGVRLAGAILNAPETESVASPDSTTDGGAIVYLQGDLGAGKTTLARGIVRGFGYQGSVKSPTYTLVEPYELPQIQLYHFDLYRLGDAQEVEFLGVDEYFESGNVCLFEWPDKGKGSIPDADLIIELSDSGTGRLLRCQIETDKGKKIAQRLWP